MKVPFVGGGSLAWDTDLLTDMVLNAPLHGATVALQDINQAAIEAMARMGRKISGQERLIIVPIWATSDCMEKPARARGSP